MYAIVEIAGQQFKVTEGRKIFVHRLEAEKDSILEFDRVLLYEGNEKILVGEPTVPNYIVEGKVLDHVKGDKVIVFKKKRRKNYKVKNGHRQCFSHVEIIGIGERGSIVRKETGEKEAVQATQQVAEVAAEVQQPEEKKKTAKKPASAKVAPVKKEASASKRKTGEKPADKKPAAKKTSKNKE